MDRKKIATSIKRKLWSQCGGYCQNPNCNKYLFLDINDKSVTIAEVAHIIGAGRSGPRSEHTLAQFIDKNGINNLIILCLECHKVIDALEEQYSVGEIIKWKNQHSEKISALFQIPKITDENKILQEVNDLLEENKLIFDEYGPFSKKAIESSSGDVQKIWKKKCLETILPNNQKIIDLIHHNKNNFKYPWELYRQMLRYKIHVESFKENCFIEQKFNDYKRFPLEFSYFVKDKLEILAEESSSKESIEYRNNTINEYINRFLANHSFIESMSKRDRAIFNVCLKDERELKVFVTNNYYFTGYILEEILSIDPNIDAIICSNPYSTYSESAKKQCIEMNIGLFKLNEFMGAIHYKNAVFLNYLLKADRQDRIDEFSSKLRKIKLSKSKCKI
ncbi:MAG: nucleotidyltransferase domain-containing protein [Cyanobacteria bacterium SBLK]|nr:nucleotidyltransferase domain-containing protein [Cyanobacteria bacterium SBLK]